MRCLGSLPRLMLHVQIAAGGWSLTKSAKQNGEPFIAVFTVSWLGYVAWQLP